MRHIIIYKLDLLNNVYKLFGNKYAIIERTDIPISITSKNGFRYLLLNKYKRSFVNAKFKQITAKNIYTLEKKYGILLLISKNEIIT